MTIVPVNGKEGTLSFGETLPELNWPFMDVYYQPDNSDPISTNKQNPLARKIKKIIANTGIIYVNNCTGLFRNSLDSDSNKTYSTQLTYVDITSFNTVNCPSFASMFLWQSKLKTVKTGKFFKGTNATRCSNMFNGCYSMEELNLSEFNTPKCIRFDYMLDFMPHLKELNLSQFDTTAIINLALSNNDLYNAQWADMNSFVNEHMYQVDNQTGIITFGDYSIGNPGTISSWDSLTKVTFGDKCIGKPNVTYQTQTGTKTNDIGFPYCIDLAMYHRNYKQIPGVFSPDTRNKWTKTDGTYKNLDFDDIKDKYTNDSSFKLAGTWVRDDALTQYNVTFNDGYMKNTLATKSAYEGGDINKTDFPSAKSYASNGIKFEGWFDENGNDCSNGIKNVTRNMIVTARYRPYLVTAKFVLDDGSEAHVNMNTAYRTQFTLPKYTGKVPVGKEFVFWSTKQVNGNTHLLHEGESVDVSTLVKCPTDDNETITFTAVFTAIKSDTNTNQNTTKNDSKNDAENTVSNTNTNINANMNIPTQPATVSSPVTSQQSQPQQQSANDLVQTGVDVLPEVLTVLSASAIAFVVVKRRK